MLYEEGKLYHIYNRGCDKNKIFQDSNDYGRLLKIIANSDYKKYVDIIAYALMPNHYHILVKQTSNQPAYKWIKYIFNTYVQYYNHRHNRSGTLFEGRAKVKEIYKSDYLGLITHYIHTNPKTELQKKYSSISSLSCNPIINKEFYLEIFDGLEDYYASFERYQLDKHAKEEAERVLL